jgi:sporulation-control protein spo0M
MFGFGKGKIDIAIQKSNYAPGDTISGNVALTLKKLAKAREMSISLIGEQRITTTQETVSRGILSYSKDKSTTTQRVRIYDFKLPLDSEREYSQGREYPFEIKIPADILNMRPQKTGAVKFSPVKWYLLSKLDIPHGLDIRKKVGITIG